MNEIQERELSRTQISALYKGRGANIKYAPFAFAELRVAMFSSVLNSVTVIEINRNIIITSILCLHTELYPAIIFNIIVSRKTPEKG